MDMHKVLSRWVLRMLTVKKKLGRHVMSQEILTLLKADFVKYLERIMGSPLSAWVEGEIIRMKKNLLPHPQKFKSVTLRGKVMVFVSWMARGYILVKYFQEGETVNVVYYTAQLTLVFPADH